MTDRFPRAALVLIVAAALVITLAGLRATAGIVGPTLLALVLTITVHPVRRWLAEKNLPDWAVSLIVVTTVYILLILLTLSLVYAGARMATLLPSYVPKIQEYINDVGGWLEDKGVGDSQVSAAVNALDASRLLSIATSLAGAIVALLSNLFFIVTLALFMAFDTRSTERVLDRVRGDRPHLVDALVSFTQGTRNYMAVSAGFGFIVAVIDGVALWVMGVPGAFVWAVLAFVTNFIPNIGFVIGVIPPAIIGLLEGGPGLMIGVIIVYSVINVVIQSVIQPRYVGDKVGLSPTITMLSLVFWAWALGALGALLAVPLSLLARALLVEADPEARWALPLIAGKPDFKIETGPDEVEAAAAD
ncbi:AI-2E family transporter [Nocardioides sp.]|uniref:AI-2E family transporter n=1 Tax=Nocardioides sp. TaxID=35761 RepID=UPI0035274F3C